VPRCRREKASNGAAVAARRARYAHVATHNMAPSNSKMLPGQRRSGVRRRWKGTGEQGAAGEAVPAGTMKERQRWRQTSGQVACAGSDAGSGARRSKIQPRQASPVRNAQRPPRVAVRYSATPRGVAERAGNACSARRRKGGRRCANGEGSPRVGSVRRTCSARRSSRRYGGVCVG